MKNLIGLLLNILGFHIAKWGLKLMNQAARDKLNEGLYPEIEKMMKEIGE